MLFSAGGCLTETRGVDNGHVDQVLLKRGRHEGAHRAGPPHSRVRLCEELTKIAHHGLKNNLIKELKNNDEIRTEVFFNKKTRFDFLVRKNKQKSFIEVKNVTLFRNKNTAEFPDAVTDRGSKHLLTLIDAIKKGYKAYLLFLIQIQNMEYFKIAKDIDPIYYKNFLLAKKAGVNMLAYRAKISTSKIIIEKKIKIISQV